MKRCVAGLALSLFLLVVSMPADEQEFRVFVPGVVIGYPTRLSVLPTPTLRPPPTPPPTPRLTPTPQVVVR